MYKADLAGVAAPTLDAASAVCPFSDDAPNEDTISTELFAGLPVDDGIGRFAEVLAGRRIDTDELVASSSGGLTSWLLRRLLEQGDVDGIVHVGSAHQATQGELFAYRVSDSPQEVERHRKSIYFATSLEDVLRRVRGDGKRYAVVGVPCFIKGLRLLTTQDTTLNAQIRYCVGIVCGHLKSQFFAEALAWQLGLEPNELGSVDFRVKQPGLPANRYAFEARPATESGSVVRSTAATMFGGDWGMGLFQPEACNFCDDIFAETADIVFGDAWLPQFNSDWRGMNVLVTRDQELAAMLAQGHASGELQMQSLTAAEACESQASNFRHRRVGLAIRLADDRKRGLSVPSKRVQPDPKAGSRRRRRIVRARRNLSAASFDAFVHARSIGDYGILESDLDPLVRRYRRASRSPVRRALSRTKGLIKQLLCDQ
jgi:coenzyme F420-reducing hydrogenase beta subunit